ncbi:hypothetical protein ACH4FX_38075 [Streptomyces sp. NPDC018019]|uniref:hypothetical protein n=1 Tax=Streptomyces sp. NPDC018019 TaxID=3365030 RepID=UPI0037ACD41C
MTANPPVATVSAQGDGAVSRSGLLGTTTIDDPGALKKAGAGALELAGELKSKEHIADGALHIGGQDLIGDSWGGELGNAMFEAKELWAKQSAALVQTCRDLHEQCTTTADNYTTTETANAESMHAVSKTRSPFG